MKFSTWDIETTDWNRFTFGAIYDGTQSYRCYSIEEIIRTMIRIGGVFYAHFGGGFDNLFLLRFLKGYVVHWKNIGSLLTKITVHNNTKEKLFELRDSFPILPASLNSLGKEFLGRGKQDIDRTHIQRYTKKEIEAYCIDDCVLLYDVLTIYLKRLQKSTIKMTIASESMHEFKTTYDIKKVQVPAVLDTYLRKSYAGARVEVFSMYGTNLQHYDFNSAYPSVMASEQFPTGKAVYTKQYRKDRLGIYTCRVTSPKYLKIPFLHTYNNNKIIFPLGTWSGTYTSVEGTCVGLHDRNRKGLLFHGNRSSV